MRRFFLPRKILMGRPRKTTIIQQLAQEAVAQKAAKVSPQKGVRQVKMRPIKLFEILITHEDYTFESRLFDETGIEYVAKKKGGEK